MYLSESEIGVIDYTKELLAIEECLLDDVRDAQSSKNETVLAGHNVKGRGDVVVFKQKKQCADPEYSHPQDEEY